LEIKATNNIDVQKAQITKKGTKITITRTNAHEANPIHHETIIRRASVANRVNQMAASAAASASSS